MFHNGKLLRNQRVLLHLTGPSRDLGDYRDDLALMYGMLVESVAKIPRNRVSLPKAAVSGDPKLFLASDSAPRYARAKKGGCDGKKKHAAVILIQPFGFILCIGCPLTRLWHAGLWTVDTQNPGRFS